MLPPAGPVGSTLAHCASLGSDIGSEVLNNALQVKNVLLSGCISTGQLVLKEGQTWKLFLDIYVLDADGAIFDVCLLAALAALLALKLPSAEINEDGKVRISVSFHSCFVTAFAAMSPDSACVRWSSRLCIRCYSVIAPAETKGFRIGQ